MLSLGAPKAVRHTIHMKSTWGHFVEQTMELTNFGKEILVHELGHIWQFQNGGYAYIPLSLWAQYRSWKSGGTRNLAYNWRAVHEAEVPWEEWNPEQQATAIEDYSRYFRRVQKGSAAESETEDVQLLEKYMNFVRDRKGAPRLLDTIGL